MLALKWANVDVRAGLVTLDQGMTENGTGRVLPFADYPQLAAVIDRRADVKRRLAWRA